MALSWMVGCKAPITEVPSDPEDAFATLSSSGPEAFARVDARLYRGGDPSAEDLARLRALGVTRVVDLRRGGLGSRNAERAAAHELGMEYIEYPFYGIFGVEPGFLDGLLAELQRDDGGAIYVHCSNGRDRTSLVVALYRVVVDGWDPEAAWQSEALDRGHRPSRTQREIQLTFQDYVLEHQNRRATADAAVDQRRLVDLSLRGEPARGRAAAVSP